MIELCQSRLHSHHPRSAAKRTEKLSRFVFVDVISFVDHLAFHKPSLVLSVYREAHPIVSRSKLPKLQIGLRSSCEGRGYRRDLTFELHFCSGKSVLAWGGTVESKKRSAPSSRQGARTPFITQEACHLSPS